MIFFKNLIKLRTKIEMRWVYEYIPMYILIDGTRILIILDQSKIFRILDSEIIKPVSWISGDFN